MTAKLATVDDRILAHAEEAGTIRDEGIVLRSASDALQVGAIQFDCGYLSPYFVTHPERMEVAFENAYILIHEKKISSNTKRKSVPKRTCCRFLSRSQRVASRFSLSRRTLVARRWRRLS
jgi:hypothetical protein